MKVEAPGRPVRAEGEAAKSVADYVARITRLAGLPDIELEARDDMMRVVV
jgi:hypothetical protein